MALGQIVDLLGTKFDNVSELPQPQGAVTYNYESAVVLITLFGFELGFFT